MPRSTPASSSPWPPRCSSGFPARCATRSRRCTACCASSTGRTLRPAGDVDHIATVPSRRPAPRAGPGLVAGRRRVGRRIRGAVYGWSPSPGTAARTLRSVWAAPSSPALSNGTTIFALSLSANFASASSWRIATSVGSGSSFLMAEYTVVIACERPSASRIAACRLPSARKIAACRPPSALLNVGVDALAFGESLVESHRPDDRPQSRACECVDGHIEIGDAEQGLLGVDHLSENGGVDRDDHVVLGDHILTVAGPGDLPHVDTLEGFDERLDDHQSGLVRLAVLAEMLHDPDFALLDDVDHLAQCQEQHDHHEDDDDEADDTRSADVCDHGGSSFPLPEREPSPASTSESEGRWPPTGHTVSVVPRTAVTRNVVPGGMGTPAPLTARQRSPASRTWPTWSKPPTRSSVSTSCPTRPPWTPGTCSPS